MYRFIIIVLLMCCVVQGRAESFTVNGIAYTLLSDNTVNVAKNSSGYSGDIVIPSTVSYNGVTYPVVGVDDRAFQANTSLACVVLPEGLTSIGSYAFNKCTALDSVSLPSTLTMVGRFAFNKCTALSSISLPDGITYIPQGLFYFCSALKSVKLPANLVSIERNGFSYCASLSTLSLPSSCTNLGNSPFNGCGFTKFEVPEGVTLIPSYCFSSCHQLSEVVLPSTVDSIAANAFQDCQNLTSVSLPSSLHGIGNMAFASSALKTITLPDNVAYVGNQCFYNCASLETVTFGKGLVSLGDNVFTKYKNTASMSLKDLYIFGSTLLSGGTGFDEALYAYTTVHVPSSLIEQYKAAEGWSKFSIVGIDDATMGLNTLKTSSQSSAVRYNLMGSRVSNSAKGIYILNGKKYINH